jgi:DNA invertase Pin-like site-specific DNA recombinase
MNDQRTIIEGLKPQRVAVYARCSTRDQHAGNQIDDLEQYAAARRWSIVGRFIDEGISGARRDRPGLDAMMKMVRQRKVDTVLVWKYDRFARSMSHLLQALEEFRSVGVNFVSFTEGIDTTSSMGKFVFGVFSSLAEFERSLIAERVKNGMDKARKRGTHLGRPRLTVDAAEIERLRSQGLSVRRIAAQVGISKSTVSQLLS